MVFEKIKEIIVDQLGVSEDSITMESDFSKDLNADSLEIFQIITELEDTYDIEFSNDDAEKIKTIRDAVNYIEEAIK